MLYDLQRHTSPSARSHAGVAVAAGKTGRCDEGKEEEEEGEAKMDGEKNAGQHKEERKNRWKWI